MWHTTFLSGYEHPGVALERFNVFDPSEPLFVDAKDTCLLHVYTSKYAPNVNVAGEKVHRRSGA